jgi:uncharacterized protein
VSRTVAVIGASANRQKFGNKAVRAFQARGYTVWPVNPHAREIEGLRAYGSVAELPATPDVITIYVPPAVGLTLIDAVARAGAHEVWLNPGSESDALLARARVLGLEPILACSIMAIGDSPSRY